MLGDSNNGNFIQLLLSAARYDYPFYKWLEKKLISLLIRQFKTFSKNFKKFQKMADEVTEVSSYELLVICIRWIDHNFEPHEDMIGFYQIEDIKSEALFNSIKDTLNRMDIPLMDCRGQCYDGTSNMVGAKTGVATRIKEIESRTLLA